MMRAMNLESDFHREQILSFPPIAPEISLREVTAFDSKFHERIDILQPGRFLTHAPNVMIVFHALTGGGHEQRVSSITKRLSSCDVNVCVLSLGRNLFHEEGGIYDYGKNTLVVRPKHFFRSLSQHKPVLATNEEVPRRVNDAADWLAGQQEDLVTLISSVRPSLLGTEFYPMGYDNNPAFKMVLELTDDVEKICIVRDFTVGMPELAMRLGIFDDLRRVGKDPHTIFKAADPLNARRRDILEHHYKAVFVMGDGTLPASMGMDPHILAWLKSQAGCALRQVGYASEPVPARTEMPDEHRPILVTSGSGSLDSGSRELYDSVVTAFERGLLKDLYRRVIVVLGPSYPKEFGDELMARAEEVPGEQLMIVRNLPSDELSHLIANSAVAVTKAGLNTTLACMTAQVPSILVPKHDAEQLARAYCLRKQAGNFLPVLLDPKPEVLSEAIFHLLEARHRIVWPKVENTQGDAYIATEISAMVRVPETAELGQAIFQYNSSSSLRTAV
jgi:predicted glycosyltransferase